MKSILILLICTISLYCSSQCEKYYIQKHLGGSPICDLSAGDYIEICLDENEVNGCPSNFYIYDKGYENGSLTYKLSLDRGWSTHYMTLMVNPKTKKIGFLLQGQQGYYSYFTENEMELINAEQEEQQAIENQKRVELAILQDEKRCLLIDQLYLEQKIEEAKSEMDQLNFPENYKNKQNLETAYLSFIKLKKEREAKEDLETINNVRMLLNSNDIEKVVQLWSNLHSKINFQKTKDSIFQIILRNETGNIPVSLPSLKINEFIELNKVQIGKTYSSITKDTNIIIQFDQQGQCLKKESYTWNSTEFKRYGDDFITYKILKIPISLKIVDKLIEGNNQTVYAGTTKPLVLNYKGTKFYKLNFFTGSIFRQFRTPSQIFFDQKLPKNQIRVEEFYTRDLFANEIKLSSIEIKKSYNEKLSPNIFRIVRRTGLITFGLPWTVLRIIEILSIK